MSGHSPTMLHFNTRSTFTGWWDNAAWRGRFEYDVEYGTPDDGLTLTLHPASVP